MLVSMGVSVGESVSKSKVVSVRVHTCGLGRNGCARCDQASPPHHLCTATCVGIITMVSWQRPTLAFVVPCDFARRDTATRFDGLSV